MNGKTDAPSDLFQIAPDGRMRRRSCFSLAIGRSSIATRCKWGQIHLGKL